MIYKNLFIVLSLLFLLVNKVIYGQQFIPKSRIGHAAILAGDKIYFIGGYNYNDASISDFFYLGGPTKTWVDLRSQGVILPLLQWHTVEIGGANQDSLFIIGGESDQTNLVYQFDTKTNAVNIPIIQGITPPNRIDMKAVSYQGKIYIFSGRIISDNGNTFFDNFDILDTVNLSWRVGSLIGAPLPRFEYTATLVNGVIYYIGGFQQDELGQIYSSMTNIYQYDIGTDTWSLKIATGDMPAGADRSGHSAVLIGNKICIYGGKYRTTGMAYAVPPINPIVMLDTTTLVWSVPLLDKPNIPLLVYHSATLVDKLMLVAFGNFTDIPDGAINNNFYIFDFGNPVINWTSLTAEELGAPNPKSPDTPNPSPNAPNSSPNTSNSPVSASPTTSPNAKTSDQQSSNKTLIVGLSAGLATIGIATIVVFSLIYRRMKKNTAGDHSDTTILQIPSSNDINNKYYSYSKHPVKQYPINQQHPEYPVKQYPINQQRSEYPVKQYPINQQYPPVKQPPTPQYHSHNPNYSPTPTFIQPQGHYSPGQEFSALPPPQESFSNSNSSNYSPGCETNYSQRSETNYSQRNETNYFPGSETNYCPKK